MSSMRRVRAVVVATSLLSFGCHQYFVPERALDAYVSLPRAERKTAVVPAERNDGARVFVLGRDVKPLAATRGELRHVQVARGRTAVGIVLAIEGAILLATGIGVAVASTGERTCDNDACNAVADAIIGGTLAGIGGVELIIGATLTGTGARVEVPAGNPRFRYLP